MAGLSTTAFLLGRDRAPVRVLAVAVTALVLIDPLLVWSIGFWLSVGATLGVSAIGPWLAARFDRIDRTGIFSLPLGVTLGAQIGVMLPAVLVFGRLPLVSIPANLLAVPVAGAVMLYGMPAGLVAGWIPVTAPVLMFPARFGTPLGGHGRVARCPSRTGSAVAVRRLGADCDRRGGAPGDDARYCRHPWRSTC